MVNLKGIDIFVSAKVFSPFGGKPKVKLTNKFGLPRTIVNAMERDTYTMGAARMSVTGLLKPPRIGMLYKQHHDKIERDVTDGIWALFGQALHAILERGGDEEHIPEERLFAEVRGWIISGQIDLQKFVRPFVKIIDYKSTSAYAVMNEKREWVEQLNVYRWLVETATPHRVSGLGICAFVRDWSRHRAAENTEYPQAPTIMIDIPLWSFAEAAAFVEERVRIHQAAITSSDMGDELPECTDEERWMRPDKWAVKKTGNKRAIKVHDTHEEAQQHLANLLKKTANEDKPAFIIEHRKSEPIRCTGDYCHVSAWCSQYARWKKENE